MSIDDEIIKIFYNASERILHAEHLIKGAHYQSAAKELVKSYNFIYALKQYCPKHPLTKLSELLYFNTVDKLKQGGD